MTVSRKQSAPDDQSSFFQMLTIKIRTAGGNAHMGRVKLDKLSNPFLPKNSSCKLSQCQERQRKRNSHSNVVHTLLANIFNMFVLDRWNAVVFGILAR